jgi:ketosteroid isomerase-like protein
MSNRLLFVFCLFIVVGCARQQGDELSPQQKEQSQKEVMAVTDSIISKWAALDAEGALQYYSDSPDWVWFGPGGTGYDFQAFKKLWREVNQSTAMTKVTTVREQFTVISRDVVICAWEGKDENTLKTGDRLTYDPHAITFLFKRMGGQWKVTYTHESGIPVVQKAGKH